MLVNTQPSARGGCLVELNRTAQTLRLADDTGAGWSAPVPDSGRGAAENSQCRVGFWRTEVSGKDLKLALELTFKPAFAGGKTLYLSAEDSTGKSTGWQTFGAWSIALNQPPVIASLQPSSGSGLSGTLTFTLTDPNGADDLKLLTVLLSKGAGGDTCGVLVDLEFREVRMLTESLGPAPELFKVGAPGAVQNSLCGVDVSRVTVSASGVNLTVSLPAVFTARMAGTVEAHAALTDCNNTGPWFKPFGLWTVPQNACARSLSPSTVSIDENESSGTIAVAAGSGCPWLASSNAAWLTISSGFSGSGSGAIRYQAASNRGETPRTAVIAVSGQSATVTQKSRAVTRPELTAGGVVNGASFQPGIASATWITVRGARLASATRIWTSADFNRDRLPTQLDGTSVILNGKPAYVYYINPTQLNVLAPDDAAEGPVSVEVVTREGRSVAVTANKQKLAPAFFPFDPEGRRYAAAVHSDGAFVGKPGLFPGAAVRAARPGDLISLFGTGFGETDPAVPTGQIVSAPAPLRDPVVVRIGNVPADVTFAGLVSSGLYQLNIKVPETPAGDQPLGAEIAGFKAPAGLFLSVER